MQIAQISNRLRDTRLIHHSFEMFNVRHLEKRLHECMKKIEPSGRRPNERRRGHWDDLGKILCQRQRRQQFNSHPITNKICVLPITPTSTKMRYLGSQRSNSILLHGEDLLLLHDTAIKLSKAKVHVHPDSVLCLGKMHEHGRTKVGRTCWMVHRFHGRSRIVWNQRRAILSSSGIFSQDTLQWNKRL